MSCNGKYKFVREMRGERGMGKEYEKEKKC